MHWLGWEALMVDVFPLTDKGEENGWNSREDLLQ